MRTDEVSKAKKSVQRPISEMKGEGAISAKSPSSQSVANGHVKPGSHAKREHRDLNSLHRPSRVIIDRVQPAIDAGRFAAKRYIDEEITVTATLLIDGHDKVKARLYYRHETETDFHRLKMSALGNDQWSASFEPKALGRYYYFIEAAIDRFGTWKSDVTKKLEAGQDVRVDFMTGSQVIGEISQAPLAVAVSKQLKAWSTDKKDIAPVQLQSLLNDPALIELADQSFDEASTVRWHKEMPIQVEPVLARYSSWYEFFPRSTVDGSERHGTFKDAEARLDYVKKMGFNVVYFPPIHPIGRAFRKGKNNLLTTVEGDVGSPWAIGAKEGGHKDILPDLGSFADFDSLVKKARSMNIEIAMDIAFQCSPDHPYVKEHPEWFKKRPDGTIQYAENPPKKYQDIYPFDFESSDWRGLWNELKDVVQFWVDRGVKVFRVDNPHTKALHFWEWLIHEIRADHPEVIFLAEAFTRPHLMAYLAKSGFSQSYTYFAWRNVKWELTQYMNELTKTELIDYFAPNFWPNTPDILPEPLHAKSRAIYSQRLILAATLSSNFGIYGPTFELMEYQPRHEGSEEYLDSEKYQLRSWKLDQDHTLAPLIRRVNEIRRNEKALQQNRNFEFHPVSNDSMIAFSKTYGDEKILVVVNLDPHHTQSGMVELPLIDWKIEETETIQVHDLLNDARYYWTGWRNYVELNPQVSPAHIFRIRRKVRSQTEFDYFI